MDTPTAPTAWRTVLYEQRRSLRWLAEQTGKAPRTVYAYSRGDLIPSAEWLDAVSDLLGETVGHLPRRAA